MVAEARTRRRRPRSPASGDPSTSLLLHFPPYRFDPATETLWSGRRRKSLRPRAAALLHYLIEHAGEVVAQEELLAALWPGVKVGPGVLKVYVWEIRQALRDRQSAPRFVETVPRRGYRWIAPLTVGADGAKPPGSREARLRGAETLVGRRAALAELGRRLACALGGDRQVVFVTGEAGIGKTSLVDAFLRSAAVRDLRRAEGQCIQHYGVGEPYLPVLSALGQLGRGPARRSLVRSLQRHAPTWLVQLPSLLDAKGLEQASRESQGANRERMMRELAEALESLSARQGLVLVLEDLQWSDSSTLDLVAFLARRSGRAKLLVLATYRPEDGDAGDRSINAVADELAERRLAVELPLGFLTESDVAQYLKTRFGGDPEGHDLRDLARAIHRRTEGNPFFMVNVVDDLLPEQLGGRPTSLPEAAAKARRSVPPSLRQMIERRVERLDPNDQLLLEAASAAGAVFPAAAVAATLESSVEDVEKRCARLGRTAQLLQPAGSEEWPDGTVSARYGFVHALYQSVLYDRLTAARRRALHRRIGERLEEGFGARAGEIAAELAAHFENGRETERAVRALELAADNALRKHASAEAARHLSKAIELLATLPATPERARRELALQVKLGAPLVMTRGYSTPEVVATYGRVMELCREIGEGPELLFALVGLYRFSLVRSELRTAKRLGERALRLAAESGIPIASLAAQLMLGLATFSLGELTVARAHFEKALALYDPDQHRLVALSFGDDPGVSCLAELAMTLWFLGYPDQALQRSLEALECARRVGIPYSTAFALGYAAWSRLFRREAPLARDHADAAVKIATDNGLEHWVAQGTAIRGWVLVELGQLDEGADQIREGLAIYEAIGAEVIRPWHLGRLAVAHARSGRVGEARAALDEAFVSMGKREERFYEAELHRLKGELALGTLGRPRAPECEPEGVTDRDRNAAEECFGRAIEIAGRQRAKSLELRAVTSLARLWSRRGEKGKARRRLAETYSWFTEGFETGDLREARELLARLG
jgi:predicted ATPase/DNA-binding winged helix-turn-helix (wHTH) protein